jgi:hypothetical protein
MVSVIHFIQEVIMSIFNGYNMLTLVDTKCQHEYLPDEDGTVYTCGSDDDVKEHTDSGLYLCHHHRNEYRTMFRWDK